MNASAPIARHEARVSALEPLTHDIRLVRLRIVDGAPLRFCAGQYAQLGFADLPPTDYSMASRPDQDELEFLIRDMGRGVSRYVVRELQLGERVRVEGPFGDCYLREEHHGPILGVAGGSGLAPILSIVESALIGGWRQPVGLYFGVRSERDLFFVDRLDSLAARYPGFAYHTVVEAPRRAGPHRAGLVTDALVHDFARLAGHKAYLAGPPAMVDAAAAVLRRLGVPDRDLHADAFVPMAEKSGSADGGGP